MPKVFLTLKLKIRQPTGRKLKVLREVKRLYAEAITMILDAAKEDLPRLFAMTPEQRKGRGVEKALRLPEGAGVGLHSSLRNAAKLAVAAVAQSYLELKKRAAEGKGDEPAWPGDAENPWPEYVRVLDELAVIADNEEREAELRNQLGMAAFQVKEQKRKMSDILWFPACAAPYRSAYSGLLNDGKNWFAIVYLLAPEHPLAKSIKGDGTLFDVENRAWSGRSKCALVLPLETDRHDWQHKCFLNAFLGGDASLQSAQIYQEQNGDWIFAVQSAWKRQIEKPTNWLGLAFENVWPVLCSPEGRVIQLAGSELQIMAKLALLLRASKQQQGKDVSYERAHGVTSKQVVHLWANMIVEIAQASRSGIAITGAGRPILGVPRARLNQVLQYKAALVSLPCRFTSTKDAAWTCPQCGAVIEKPDKKPWPSQNECRCGTITTVGHRIAWHLAIRATEKYVE